MEQKLFIEKLFQKAHEAGFEKAEVYMVTGESFRVRVFEAQLEEYKLNTSLGLSFRGLIGSKMGYAATEVLDEAALEHLVMAAKDNLSTIESEEVHFIFDGAKEYPKVEGLYAPLLDDVSPQDKIQLALTMEDAAKQLDPRVKQMGYCIVGSGFDEVRILNTQGMDLSVKENFLYAILEPIVEVEGAMQDGSAYRIGRDLLAIDPDAIAREAVEEALAYIGAKKVKSGSYPVLFRRDAACAILSTFAGVFSGDAAQKGYSLLKGREGEDIASAHLTLCDDPLMAGGYASRAFDDEGVPTRVKNIIDGGTLTTLMHNLRTAHTQGIASTGNARRGSYAASVGVAPTNFYIKPGTHSYDEMVMGMDSGVIITQMMGMHAGANAISGDFSLAAKGFYVEGGRIVHPVEQITVAGNFFTLLKDVVDVGSDLWFDMPSSCHFGSPSLMIKELSIAGE